jgi:1,4-dihydroxy-2-naphthoate octaprenyltransferase
MDLTLLVPFRKDAGVAQRATPARRKFMWGVMVPYPVTLVLTWMDVIPRWVLWPLLVALFLVVTVLGNVWADQDALDALEEDAPSA